MKLPGDSMRDLSPNQLAWRFVLVLSLLTAAYGLGMMLVILSDDKINANRMISGFSSMFAGLLGFGGGYMLGARDKDKPADRDKRE